MLRYRADCDEMHTSQLHSATVVPIGIDLVQHCIQLITSCMPIHVSPTNVVLKIVSLIGSSHVKQNSSLWPVLWLRQGVALTSVARRDTSLVSCRLPARSRHSQDPNTESTSCTKCFTAPSQGNYYCVWFGLQAHFWITCYVRSPFWCNK